MAEFTLYNAPQSTCSQRVRFVLHAKGLVFDERKLDLFSGDQLKPDYLKLNPNGVVPTLVHQDGADGGGVVIDSAVIMEYLDELYPEPGSLRPPTRLGVAHLRSLMRFIDEVPTPAIRIPSYNLAFLPHFQAMSEANFQALAESKPLRKEFLLKMGRTGFSEDEMRQANDRLARAVARMDEAIAASGGPFLMGEQLTLADIAIMPVIVRMADINLDQVWDRRPTIGRWLALIQEQPEFDKTYYHGSLLTEKYPHLASIREGGGGRMALRPNLAPLDRSVVMS